MNRRTKVRFPVFSNFEVHVIFAHDIVRTGRRFGADLSDAEAAYIPDADNLAGRIVFNSAPTEQIIAHEASHAVRAMFAVVGVRTDNETYAYHLGYLVGRIHKFIKLVRPGC